MRQKKTKEKKLDEGEEGDMGLLLNDLKWVEKRREAEEKVEDKLTGRQKVEAGK